MYTLFTVTGWGSVLAEAGFALAEIPYRREEVDLQAGGPARDRLFAANPLGQLPTVLMPDGTVLTESAAIFLHLADHASVEAALAPPPDAPSRPHFLRWLIFLVAALYPTWTYGDEPSRYVDGDVPQKTLRASTDQLRQKLWLQMESVAGDPYFLGQDRSAIDLYIWAMTHWRPGAAWFAAQCPTLVAIAKRIDADPRLAEIRRRNWPA